MNNIKLRDKIFIRSSVGKLEGRIPLGGPRHRREDNIKCILKIILGCGLVLCDSVQDCCDHCNVRFELYKRRFTF